MIVRKDRAKNNNKNSKSCKLKAKQVGKPLGSKYLGRALSGLRIVILSKGSDILVGSVEEF